MGIFHEWVMNGVKSFELTVSKFLLAKRDGGPPASWT